MAVAVVPHELTASPEVADTDAAALKAAAAAAFRERDYALAARLFAAARDALLGGGGGGGGDAEGAAAGGREVASLASNASAAALAADNAGDAEKWARCAVSDDPGWAKAHFRLGEALAASGAATQKDAGGAHYDHNAAIDVLSDPDQGLEGVRKRLESAEASASAYGGACRAFDAASERAPDDPTVSARLIATRTAAAVADVLKDLWKEFEADAAKATDAGSERQVAELTSKAEERERPPEATEALKNGEMLLARRDVVGAEAAFRSCLAADGSTYQAAHGLGMTLQQQGRLAEACEAFRRAMSTAFEYMPPYIALGGALEAMGEDGKAETIYRRAHRIAPDFVSTNTSLALLLIKQGKLADAVRLLRMALAGGPEGKFRKAVEDPTCALILGYVLQMQGYTAEPQSYFLRCCSDAGGNSLFQYLNARSCVENDAEMCKRSVETLARILAKYPKRYRDDLLQLNWRFDAPQWRFVGTKVGLHSLLDADPESASYWPESYALPRESRAALIAARAQPGSMWIVKDSASSGGYGMRILTSESVNEAALAPSNGSKEALVQRYIERPLLLAGRKFSVRMYVVVLGWPARAWICNEGQLLFCARDYGSDVTAEDLASDRMRHLTNQQLNVKASDEDHELFEQLVAPTADSSFEEEEEPIRFANDVSQAMREAVMDAVKASKRPGFSRTLDPLRAHCSTVGRSFDTMWAELRTVCLKCAQAGRRCFPQRVGSLTYKMHARMWIPKVLGIDVMLDEDYKVWLLEVNRYPALHPRGKTDFAIKRALVTDSWRLALSGGGLGDGTADRGEQMGCLHPLMDDDGSDALTSAMDGGSNSEATLGAAVSASDSSDADDDLDL